MLTSRGEDATSCYPIRSTKSKTTSRYGASSVARNENCFNSCRDGNCGGRLFPARFKLTAAASLPLAPLDF